MSDNSDMSTNASPKRGKVRVPERITVRLSEAAKVSLKKAMTARPGVRLSWFINRAIELGANPEG